MGAHYGSLRQHFTTCVLTERCIRSNRREPICKPETCAAWQRSSLRRLWPSGPRKFPRPSVLEMHCDLGYRPFYTQFHYTYTPSMPKNSMTSTFSLHSSTFGVLTPPCSSRLKLRSSFSAQTRIILRGFFEDEYSPRKRCSPSMYACLDRKLRMDVR
jgi:hypothetical protein